MADALKITLAGAALTRHLGYVEDIAFKPVVTSGLLGWFNIGEGPEHSRRNWAPGGNDATIVGAPSFADGEGRFGSQSSYLQTDIPDTNQFTYIVAGRTPIDFSGGAVPINLRPTWISNYQGGPGIDDPAANSQGTLMWTDGTGILAGQTCVRNGASAPSIVGGGAPAGSVNTPSLLMQLCNNTVNTTRNLTAGTSGSIGLVYPRFRGSRTMRIGSAYGTTTGVCYISHAILFNRAIDDGEREAIAAQLREYQLRRYGRTV